MYPSPIRSHRRADLGVHAIGLALTLICLLVLMANVKAGAGMVLASGVYGLCALFSYGASIIYHFHPDHDRRIWFRRVDHAAIYTTIAGTFTPLLAHSTKPLAYGTLALSWVLAIAGVYMKLNAAQVKSKWSTVSYLALGAVGIFAMVQLNHLPDTAVRGVLIGAAFYALGTVVYSRKTIPFRYSIWHAFVVCGGLSMFYAVWVTVT